MNRSFFFHLKIRYVLKQSQGSRTSSFYFYFYIFVHSFSKLLLNPKKSLFSPLVKNRAFPAKKIYLFPFQAAGKYRQQGRNYVVDDGDIIFFKFNAGAGLTAGKKK